MVQWLIVLAEGNLGLITRTYGRKGGRMDYQKLSSNLHMYTHTHIHTWTDGQIDGGICIH